MVRTAEQVVALAVVQAVQGQRGGGPLGHGDQALGGGLRASR